MKKKGGFFFFVGLFLLLSVSSGVRAQKISQEKRTVIIKLLKLTNGLKLANEMKIRIISALKDSFPDVPEVYWKKLGKRIDVRQLLESFIPIYAENLSLNDLKQLVAFYQTSAGQHYLAAKEKMITASAEIGKKWAMGWIVQVFKELKAMGYKPKKEDARKNLSPKTQEH